MNFKVDLPLAAKYFRFSILDRVRAVGRSYLTRVFLCHQVLLRIHKHSRKWKKIKQQQQWPKTKNSRTSVLYFLEGAENSRINNETKSNNNNNEKKNSRIRMTISFLYIYSSFFSAEQFVFILVFISCFFDVVGFCCCCCDCLTWRTDDQTCELDFLHRVVELFCLEWIVS